MKKRKAKVLKVVKLELAQLEQKTLKEQKSSQYRKKLLMKSLLLLLSQYLCFQSLKSISSIGMHIKLLNLISFDCKEHEHEIYGDHSDLMFL